MSLVFLLAMGMCMALTSSVTATSVNGFGEAAKVLADIISDQFKPLKGTVVGVRGSEVYVNLGTKDRIRAGQLFQVVRPEGELKDPVTGQVIGSFESPIGTLQIQTVRESYSVGIMVEPNAQPQVGDRAFGKVERSSIAVVPFPLLSGSSLILGQAFADRLSTALAQDPNLQVVEREQLNRALEELKFGQSGLVDATSAQKLGAFLGVNALVVGTMAQLGAAVTVNMRVIDVKTGIVLAAYSVDVHGENLSGAPVERPLSISQPVTPAPASPGVSQSQPSGVVSVPLSAGSAEFEIVYRQQLQESLDFVTLGDFQGRGRLDLVGCDCRADGSTDIYMYRYIGHYERIWRTTLEDWSLFRPAVALKAPEGQQSPGVHWLFLPGDDNSHNNRAIFWDGSRWSVQSLEERALGWYAPDVPASDSLSTGLFLRITRWLLKNGILEMELRKSGESKVISSFETRIQPRVPWLMMPILGKPLPSGKYALIVSKPGEDRLSIVDMEGHPQWDNQDLSCVVAGVAADLNHDGQDEIVLAQLVDENGRPDMETKAQLLKGEPPDAKTVSTQLVLVEWSQDLFSFQVAARSGLFRGETIRDLAYGDMDNDGTSELIAITGPPSRKQEGPSAVYHIRVRG